MEDLTLLQALIYAVVVYGGARIIKRHFKKKDAAQFAAQTVVEAPLVISSFRFETNKVLRAIQEATILSVYGTLLVVILGIGVTAFGLVPSEGVGALIVNVASTIVTIFPMMVAVFTLGLIIASRRGTRPIPLTLVSKQYSLVSDLYVDSRGFEGVFALPWQRIYECEELSSDTLKISYRRSPYWLTKLIGADTLKLASIHPDEMRQIRAFYSQAKQAK